MAVAVILRLNIRSGSGVSVAMSFRNESFVAPGFIRQLAHVNAVRILFLLRGLHFTQAGVQLQKDCLIH